MHSTRPCGVFSLAAIQLKASLRFLLLLCSLASGLASGDIFAAQLPPGQVELEGTLEVFHEDRHTGSRYRHFLKTATERLELRFAKNPPALETGHRVKARGKKSKGVLALDSGSSVQTLSAPLSNTFGAQKTLVILVNFQDKATQPYTVAYAQGVVDTTSNFDLENSFQQTFLDADVVGWYTIAQNSTVCDYTTTANLAEQAATADGVDVLSYPRRVFAFPDTAACTWWGLGTVGGNPSKAWINGSFQIRVLAHEMGHNFGLYHSHALACDSSGCNSQEYGDRWDVMGGPSSVNPGHFNAFQKERLGWLNYDDGVHIMPSTTTVTTDGLYSIPPYESQDSTPKALKILKSTDPSSGKRTYYYVEHRPHSDDTLLPYAVVLRTGSESSADSSYVVDLDPTSVATDWELSVGQSYHDVTASVTIALMSADSTGATISVNTAPCVVANPTVTLSPSATQTVFAGTTVNYGVTIVNNDSSSCGESTFNVAAAVPSGWTAWQGAYSMTIAPGASGYTPLQISSTSSTPDGNYNVPVTATDAWVASHSSGTSATISIVSGCIRKNPTVWLHVPSYTTESFAAGDKASYGAYVTNNDSSSCGASTFNLTTAVPSGWSSEFGSVSLTVSPGMNSGVWLDVKSPNTAAVGAYSFSVTGMNAAAPGYFGTASRTVSVVSCTRRTPTVVFSPSNTWFVGVSGSQTITVTNNDSNECPTGKFSALWYGPAGWSSGAYNYWLTIAPGASASTAIPVAAPTGTSDGVYNFTAITKNAANSNYGATALGTIVCCSGKLTVTAMTDKIKYRRGNLVTMTVSVKLGAAAIAGSSVTANIVKAGVVLATLSGTTDATGRAVLKYQLAKTSATGTYQVNAGAAKNGYSGTGTVSFSVN